MNKYNVYNPIRYLHVDGPHEVINNCLNMEDVFINSENY